MSLHKLPRGLLEIPKGTNTSCKDNSNFTNCLERTNTLLAQFVSATDIGKKLTMRQELEESYFNLTMYNLKESIKHKIEQDMWNNLFKKYISDIQSKIKNKDKSESSKAQSEISIFLDEAVGFYSKCIDTLSLVYNIRLPGGEGQQKTVRKPRGCEEASDDDLRYIVQHCYVHMGDLSRYHNLSKHAKFYYEFAVQLNPASGHAYNQLAILESSSAAAHSGLSSGNCHHIIRTMLMYEYANSCRVPFPATKINLESLLRHVNEQSVSTLLTSNSSIGGQNCVQSMCIAWVHAYANQRMLHNIQRCRQLQQRIVEWARELAKCVDDCQSRWKELVSLAALHCSLLTNYSQATEYIDNKQWTTNMHQFSQDLANAISRGLVSLSHDNKLIDELLTSPGCVSVLIIYLSWTCRHLNNTGTSQKQCPLKVPFGEDFVKFVNILATKSGIDSSKDDTKLPSKLMELHFLTGFQPLGVPCAIYDIHSDSKSIFVEENTDGNSMGTRVAFIVSVCRRISMKWSTLLSYNDTERRFVAVPPPEPTQKKHVKIEPSVVARKPVNNVALASMKLTKPNGFISGGHSNVPSRVPLTESTTTSGVIISDVKIAKCIQEHIAQDTKSVVQPDSSSLAANGDGGSTTNTNATVSTRDENHIIAPAPGLILSSNLPPEYKSMSSGTEQNAGKNSSPGEQTQLGTGTTDAQSLSSSSSTAPGSINSSKNHSSYNPNREQFEKDLPPRFANKRSFTQDSTIPSSGSAIDPARSGFFDHQNNGGFTSMNYWDSIHDYPNNGGAQFESNNLTKKESELLLPPTVPTSWLTDDNQDHIGGMKLDSAAINSASIQYPFGNSLMQQQHSQQSHLYSTIPSPQNHMSMLQQSFNQFQQNQHSPLAQPLPPQTASAAVVAAASLKEQQDNQLQYLLQAVTTNATGTPRFRSQTDALLSAQMNNFDNQLSSYIHHHQQQQQQTAGTTRLPHKFHAMPPPNQQPMNTANQNYDSPFQQTRPSGGCFYDKPVFSSSGGNHQSGGFGYASSMMPSHGTSQSMMMAQQHQQQQQVRHNNPLLNLLLPGGGGGAGGAYVNSNNDNEAPR